MTWPNVLVLEYLRQTGQSNSEIELKARLNIALGYQRMLTFQHPDSGGFSWYGQDPEHLVLTAYGLMELTDMADVFEVDPTVLTAAANFLALRQQADGHWAPPADRPFYTGGSVSGDAFQATAFIAWALLHSNLQPTAVVQAISYLTSHLSDAEGTFAKALLAVLLSRYPDADQQELASLRQELAGLGEAQPDGSVAWTTQSGGSLYNYGGPANIETTALAVLALAPDSRYGDLATKGIAYLVSQKDALGNFGSTQATVFAFKALMSRPQSSVDGTVTIFLGGQQVAQVAVTPDTSDIFRVVDLKNILSADDNQVELLFSGQGNPTFQVVGLWYVPWDSVPAEEPGPLTINVDFDRTELSVNDTILVNVTVENTTAGYLPMVIVDLGTPPGFQPVSEDLDALKDDGTIADSEITDRQVIVYTNGLGANDMLRFSYRIQATMAFSGQGEGNRVYTYYTPEVTAYQAPIAVTVQP